MTKPTLQEQTTPIPCPGGYSLDMYCKYVNPEHGFEEMPHRFYAQTYGEVKREAKKAGWLFHPNNFATCPKCATFLKGTK